MRQTIEYAKMAMRNILANKMRSVLTMLGIIIGISSVIIVLCLGNGGKESISEQLSSISNGSVYLYVNGGDVTDGDLITDADIQAIADMPDVAGVSAEITVYGDAHTDKADVPAYINTGHASYGLVSPAVMENGRYWNEGDYAAARKVCTLDINAAKELFGSDNVVGMPLELDIYGKSAEFTIVGITQSQNMSFGSVTAEVSVPLTTLASMTEDVTEPYFQLLLLAKDSNASAAVAEKAISALELRHNNAGRDMYMVMDMSQYLDEFNTVINMIAGIIAAIAGISLLVGGIGVMNIMLVSVTERTREIGIRKALGAKTRTILLQFLIESAFLTLLGGVIGIILGVVGGRLIGNLMSMNATIEPYMMVLIALFSIVIGLFFGIYPARKAAKLNPIEALRSE